MEMFVPFIIYVAVIIAVGGIIMSKKFRKFVIAVFLVAAMLFVGFTARNALAENPIRIIEGAIIKVTSEIFNEYPVLVITVETINGEVYTYYAKDEIDVTGTVTLTLFYDEVIDVE